MCVNAAVGCGGAGLRFSFIPRDATYEYETREGGVFCVLVLSLARSMRQLQIWGGVVRSTFCVFGFCVRLV